MDRIISPTELTLNDRLTVETKCRMTFDLRLHHRDDLGQCHYTARCRTNRQNPERHATNLDAFLRHYQVVISMTDEMSNPKQDFSVGCRMTISHGSNQIWRTDPISNLKLNDQPVDGLELAAAGKFARSVPRLAFTGLLAVATTPLGFLIDRPSGWIWAAGIGLVAASFLIDALRLHYCFGWARD